LHQIINSSYQQIYNNLTKLALPTASANKTKGPYKTHNNYSGS